MKLPQLSLPLCLPSRSGSSSPLDMQPSRLASADDSLSISPPSNNNKNFETSLSLSRKSRGFWHAFVLYVSYTAIYQAVSTVICWIKLNWLFTSQTWITLDERHPVKQILLCAMVFGIICNYISFLCIFLVENFLCHCFDYFFLIPRLFDRIVEGSESPNESRQRIEFSLFIYIYPGSFQKIEETNRFKLNPSGNLKNTPWCVSERVCTYK